MQATMRDARVAQSGTVMKLLNATQPRRSRRRARWKLDGGRSSGWCTGRTSVSESDASEGVGDGRVEDDVESTEGNWARSCVEELGNDLKKVVRRRGGM